MAVKKLELEDHVAAYHPKISPELEGWALDEAHVNEHTDPETGDTVKAGKPEHRFEE